MSSSERVPSACPATEARYREALEQYAATDRSIRAICTQCGVSYAGFRNYLYKYRRDLLLSRHGVAASSEADAAHTRLRGRRGQTAAARAKYGEAIAACGDAKYFEYNVSQIAQLFGLNPTGLSNQLRAHCPGLLERRERERRRLGLADNQQRGVRPWCRDQYAAAVEMLRTTELTLPEVAEKAGSPLPGFASTYVSITRICSRRAASCASRPRRKKKRTRHGQRTPPRTDTPKPRALPGGRAALPGYGHDD